MPTNSNKNVLPLAIGIDIQEASELPNVPAFREDEFYRKNFSSREIEYCAQQSSPLLSFAGKFAAKEAIIKADHRLREKPFSEIEILNNAVGVPEFGDFSISISHSQTIAIAIAIRPNIATVSDT
jgi:holo-[acyl-carrier protein] synthase